MVSPLVSGRFSTQVIESGCVDDDDDGDGDDDDDGGGANVDDYVCRRKAEFPGLPSLAFRPLSGEIYTGLTQWQKNIYTGLTQ